MRDELRRAALAWAEEVLPGPRWRLEPLDETSPRHRGTGRACYRLRLRAWEPAGTAHVRLRGGEVSVTFPAEEDDAGEEDQQDLQDPLGPQRPLVVDAALAEARRGLLPGLDALAARAVSSRTGRGGPEALVRLERARDDGVVLVDLDATTGARLGVLAAPLLRGSDRSAALSRPAAVRRARDQAGALPEGARLVRVRLSRGGHGGRVWRVRWDDRAQGVAVTLNARTGQLVAWERTVPRAMRAAAVPGREAAAAELALAVSLRLGPLARASAPVAGARAGRPVWFAVVQLPDGRLFRATLDRGRVHLVRRDARALGA